MTSEDTPTPRTRRPLAWIAVGALALGVAGGGAAALALDDGGDTIAVTPAAAESDGGATGADPGAPDPAAGGERPDHAEHHGCGVHGTVAGVDGTTVTVEDDEGTATTVTTDDETKVLDVAEGEVADVAEGDAVLVFGENGDDDVVTAHRVVDLGSLDPEDLHPDRPVPPEGAEVPDDAPEPPEGAPEPPDGRRHGPGGFRPTVGTVASVDGDGGVTVTTDDGDVAVTTSDDTEVTVVTEIAVSDLAEGDTVGARGEVADDGTVAADVIIRGELDGRPGFGGPGFGGPGGPGGPGPGGRPHDDGEEPEG